MQSISNKSLIILAYPPVKIIFASSKANSFLNFSASVSNRGASIGARETAALFMANAIFGYQAKAFTYVFGGIMLSSVLSTLI